MSIVGAQQAGSSAMDWLGGNSFTNADGSGGVSNMGMLQAGGSLLSSLGNFFTGSDYAKAARRAQEKQWKAQMANTREQYRQLGQQETQANKEYHDQLIQNQASLLQQRGQVELLAGATGTGGGSITSLLNDLSSQAGQNQSQIVSNYENQMAGFVNAAKAIQSGGQMQMREFKKPNAFRSVLQSVTGAGKAYQSGSESGKAFGKAWNDYRSYSSGVGT